MAAPLGNEFWKQRSKHGRDKIFESPKTLMDEAEKYFEWCEKNPLYEVKAFNTKDNGIVQEPVAKMRAFTMTGLCLFLGCNESYFRSFKSQARKDKEDFITVITHIESIIYTQKFTGAAADLLNPYIIARDLGLMDHTKNDNTHKGDVTITRVIKS